MLEQVQSPQHIAVHETASATHVWNEDGSQTWHALHHQHIPRTLGVSALAATSLVACEPPQQLHKECAGQEFFEVLMLHN